VADAEPLRDDSLPVLFAQERLRRRRNALDRALGARRDAAGGAALDEHRGSIRQWPVTVEHPFGAIKMRMEATQFLMETLPRVVTGTPGPLYGREHRIRD
jgi:hypothetical protein